MNMSMEQLGFYIFMKQQEEKEKEERERRHRDYIADVYGKQKENENAEKSNR